MADIKEIAIGNNLYSIKDSQAVHKTGDTMTGNLNFNLNNNLRPIIINIDGTTGSQNEKLQDIEYRNDGKRIAILRASHLTNGDNKLELSVCDNNGNIKKTFTLGYDDSAGKATYGTPQLVTTYVSGTSGYNIWSNGWCEQWGEFGASGYTSSTAVNFTKTFRNTNYQVLLSSNYRETAGDKGSMCGWNEKYVGSMSVWCCFEQWRPTVSWLVRGYLADGQY